METGIKCNAMNHACQAYILNLLAYEAVRSCLYLQRLVCARLKATCTDIGVGSPARAEPTDTRAAGLSHDAATRTFVEASIHHASDGGRKARHRRNGGVPETATEQGTKAPW